MTVAQVLEWLDHQAPFATQEAFDNVGLLLGDPQATVARVLFAVDATLPVVLEATAWEADLIITHHPLLFGGVKQIRYDTPEGAVLAQLIGERMNLIAAHTNLDSAPGGIGDSLALALGLTAIHRTEADPYLRLGTLPRPISAAALLAHTNQCLSAHARLYGDASTPLHHVAVGAGAYGEGYAMAAQAGAQAYVVGEIKHHELLAAQALGLVVLETGHHETEAPGITALYHRFQSDAQAAAWPVTAHLTAIPPYQCTIG